MTKGSNDRNQRRVNASRIKVAPPPGMRPLTDEELERICKPYIEKQAAEIATALTDDVVPDLIELRRLTADDYVGDMPPAERLIVCATYVDSLCRYFQDYFPKRGNVVADGPNGQLGVPGGDVIMPPGVHKALEDAAETISKPGHPPPPEGSVIIGSDLMAEARALAGRPPSTAHGRPIRPFGDGHGGAP